LEQAIARGSELLKQGQLEPAIRALHQGAQIDPDNTKLLALLGLAHFRGGQLAQARPIYEALVERAPTDASHRLNLGLVYLKLGEGDRAISALEASRALDPSQGRAVSYLGLAYARAGRYAEAYRSFLLAGQIELAAEIEVNLTPAERDGINSQLGRPSAAAGAPASAASALSSRPPPAGDGSPRAAPASAARPPPGPAAARPAPTAIPVPAPAVRGAEVSAAPAFGAHAPGPASSGAPAPALRGDGGSPTASEAEPREPARDAVPDLPGRDPGASARAAAPSAAPAERPVPLGPADRDPAPQRGPAERAAEEGAPVAPAAAPTAVGGTAAPATAAPHVPSDRHHTPTAPIPLPIRAAPSQTSPPAMARTTSPRAVTQNVVSRAALEESAAARGRGEARHRPPSAPPGPRPRSRSAEDVHTRPTPPPTPEVPAPEITILHGQDRPRARVSEDVVASDAIVSLGPGDSSESQLFVLPTRPAEAVPVIEPGHSRVSMAVAAASPAAPARPRTTAGGRPPRPLSELATADLIRPDESDDRLEIGAGGTLIIRVVDRVLARLDGVHVTGGDLTYEPATRRTRGQHTDERFDSGGSAIYTVTGRGYLIASPIRGAFEAVVLDDDILYLREDLVFAFESTLRWENGHVPGLRDRLPVIQLRGDGALALCTRRPLTRVKLPPQGLLLVDADRLAGWIGRVIPRAVVPARGGPLGAVCIECTGEGVLLIEPADAIAAVAAPTTPAAAPARPPPPARQSGPLAAPAIGDPPLAPAPQLEVVDVVAEVEARPALPPELAELDRAEPGGRPPSEDDADRL
jgi:hypothetical protein